MSHAADAPMDTRKGSPERFGYSWDRFFDLSTDQEKQFARWTAPIDLESGWRGVRFLDAGCGMGRNSFWPMRHGARSGVAIDLDGRSLSRARQNLASFPNVDVRGASIYEIPFENEFDIAFSIGVIHHLEHPEAAVRQLVKATRPGGRVLIWVYGYENLELFVNVLNPLRKLLFSRLPLGIVRALAYPPSAALWVLLRLGVHPIEYLKMLRGFSFQHLLAIVFDQMLPVTANYWTREQALALLPSEELQDVEIRWVNECSWTVTAIKRVTC
jgi:SAM-dependent methyltransferase